MFDLEEIPTGMTPNGRTATGPNPDKDAKARAMAMLNGLKWKCSRVGQYVSIEICEEKYADAVDFSPCRECSSIAAHLRKKGAEYMPKVTKEPAKAPTSEKTDPLAGLSLYHPGAARHAALAATDPHVYLSGNCMTFSAPAVSQFGLNDATTVSVFHDGAPGEISRLVIHIGGKMMKLSASGKGSIARKISALGMIKNLKMKEKIGKRYPIKEIAPGYLEIRMDEVGA